MENPIRNWLSENKATQEGLARKIGVSFNFMNSIINGKNTDVRTSKLKALHGATGIPYDELISYLTACTEKRLQEKVQDASDCGSLFPRVEG